MQIQFTAAPGTSLLAKSLPNGQMIKGIQIDNPSGNWLYVVSEQLYCPPYTIGWAIPVTYSQSSVNIEARLVGPAAQVGTNQGETWTLNLFDVPVQPSAGIPYQFVQQFTGLNFANGGGFCGAATSNPLTILTVPAITGKRFRIKSFVTNKDQDTAAAFQLSFGATGIIFYPQMVLVKSFNFPEGLDAPISTAFSFDAFSLGGVSFSGFDSGVFVTYEIL